MSTYLINFLSGFSIGILGSFHCIGMCGPLALSLPIQHFEPARQIVAIINYNIGRLLTYVILGAIFGWLGALFSVFRLQQTLSIVAGVVLLFIVLSTKLSFIKVGFLQHIFAIPFQWLSKVFQSIKKPIHFLGIGLANGLLPCGLVYAALITGVATMNLNSAMLIMLGFGLGTFPLMLLTMFFGRLLSPALRRQVSTWTPYILSGLAILLIMRGLNLGIPYLSPRMESHQVLDCYH